MIEDLRKELSIFPNGEKSEKIYLYLGHRSHYKERPILAKAYGTANLFRQPRAHIYENDLIAGSVRGLFSSEFDERIRQKAESDFFSYGENTFFTNSDHFAPNYRVFLKDGVPGTKEKIEDSMKKHNGEKERRFLLAVKITFDGFIDMIKAYSLAAEEKAEKTENEKNKKNLRLISEDLKFLIDNPPKTFRQALQLMFMTHTAFSYEGKSSMAFGRIDQYLYSYFKKDVESGILTEQETAELLTSVFLKIYENRYFGFDDTVNICIGGITPEGEDGTNALSYIVLKAVKNANIPGPNLSARIHSKTSDRFLDECLKVIATGLGYPALMNDEVNIPALLRHGYEKTDVNDYCFVGCIENFIAGKQPPWSDGRFNVPLYLEPIFFNGKTLINPEYIGIDTGELDDLKTMNDFLEAYHKQLEYAMSVYFAYFNNANDRYNPENYSQPFLSIFCEDCIGRAKDIRDGGAKYPSVHAPACMGIATVADSLAAIDKLVYTDKKYSLSQIAEAIKANFQGYEKMRKELLAAPKYGNDDDFVDSYAVWYVEEMERLVSPYKTRDGGPLYVGIASNVQNIPAGEEIAATPDGRKAKEPISDAASPMHGMDKEGATAVINSVSKPDYTLAACGTVLNQKFSPQMLNNEENRNKVKDLIKVYFKKKGQEIQINSVSRDILKDAMVHPEKYQNLVVRVSGFSAYYVNLDKSVQLDILKRTEHNGSDGV